MANAPQLSEAAPLTGHRSLNEGIKESLSLLFVVIGIGIAVQMGLSILKPGLPKVIRSNEWFRLLFESIGYVLAFSVSIRVLLNQKKRRDGIPEGYWRDGRVSPLDLSLLAILTMLMLLFTDPVYYLIPTPTWLELALERALFNLIQPNILSFCTIAIFPAILEEIIFRKILLHSLLEKYSPRTAILISAIAFGLVHLNPVQFAAGLIAGIFLGWIYWKTRSLLACMLVHAVNNGLSFFLVLWIGVETDLPDLMHPAAYLLMVASSGIAFLLLIRLLRNRLNAMPPAIEQTANDTASLAKNN